jgi:hypothetical protein
MNAGSDGYISSRVFIMKPVLSMVCTHLFAFWRRRHLAFRLVCEISLAYEPPPILADNQGQSDLVWRRLR